MNTQEVSRSVYILPALSSQLKLSSNYMIMTDIISATFLAHVLTQAAAGTPSFKSNKDSESRGLRERRASSQCQVICRRMLLTETRFTCRGPKPSLGIGLYRAVGYIQDVSLPSIQYPTLLS